MTTELAQQPKEDEGARVRNRPPSRPGEAFIALTRLVVFWERAWPAILPALAIPYSLIVISLFGWWRHVPALLHWITLALAGLAFAAALRRDLAGLRFASRRDAQARLEQDGAVKHAPLQALDDAPFKASAGAASLWRAHMEASAERARRARLAGMRASAQTRDPLGLRFTAAGLLVVALIAAGPDWRTRLAGALSPTQSGGLLLADLWIEPPAYTGKAPVYLLRAGEEKSGLAAQIDAPAGSVLVAQVNGRGRLRLSFTTDTEETAAGFERQGDAARAEIALQESGLLRLRLGPDVISWPVGVLADAAPRVGFTQAPTASDEGRLAFAYAAEDDYAIAEARLELRLDPDQDRPLDASAFDEAALLEVRVIALDGAGGGAGERAYALDLQSDPWAGLQALARVVVEDGAGQTGATDEETVTLPVRTFFNPLARTVVEQRQTLATSPQNWRRVGRSFDAVTLAPEVFFDNTTDYLLLRTAFWRVMRQDGEGFDDAVEKFWPLALQLEDEALELARQRLEAARAALREALERGASDQDIARLVEELRQAMDDYIAALAQSGQARGQTQGDAEQLKSSDLDEMLDAIRDLAQSGASGAARQMLSDLENVLDNLRLTQSGGGGGMEGQGSGGPADEAGEFIGRQRDLADDAFRRGQEFGQSGDDLADAEGALGDDLEEFIDQLEGGQADPDGDAAQALGRARNDMREAQEALRNEDFDGAASAMERAIDNLRDGAEELAREQMRQAGDGAGARERGAPLDPLGRPAGDAIGDDVDVPGASETGRAREIIDELRRRLGEPGRAEEEIDYLERLLERF